MKNVLIAIAAYFVIGLIYTKLPQSSRPCETAGQHEKISWPFWLGDLIERYIADPKTCPDVADQPYLPPVTFDPAEIGNNYADVGPGGVIKEAAALYKKTEATCLGDETDDPKLVIDACTIVLERGPYDRFSGLGYQNGMRPAILVRRGDAYLAQNGNPAAQLAMQDYASAIKDNPDYADAYRARTRVYAHDPALLAIMSRIPDLKQLARLEPENDSVLLDLAISNGILGNWNPAFAAINRAIELDPKPINYAARAAFHLAQNNIETARTDYNQAIEINPKFAAAYAGRALTASALKDVPSMIGDFTQAVTFNPQNGNYALLRAGAYLLADENQAALSDLYNAVSLMPDKSLPYEWRAVAFLRLGKLKDAEADCAIVLNSNIQSDICSKSAETPVKSPGPEYFYDGFKEIRTFWPSNIDIFEDAR